MNNLPAALPANNPLALSAPSPRCPLSARLLAALSSSNSCCSSAARAASSAQNACTAAGGSGAAAPSAAAGACSGMPSEPAVSRMRASRARRLDACASASAAWRPWRLQAFGGRGGNATGVSDGAKGHEGAAGGARERGSSRGSAVVPRPTLEYSSLRASASRRLDAAWERERPGRVQSESAAKAPRTRDARSPGPPTNTHLPPQLGALRLALPRLRVVARQPLLHLLRRLLVVVGQPLGGGRPRGGHNSAIRRSEYSHGAAAQARLPGLTGAPPTWPAAPRAAAAG
jgi:hypothetical protein